MTGKNFSTNNVTGKRRKSDFYETPYSITEHLLEVEAIEGLVLEPAAGDGAIVKVLEAAGKEVVYYDIEKDFFTETNHYDVIVTNPPFSLAKEFVLKAKQHSDKICFLLPLSYLHGKWRYDNIYKDADFPLASVYVFTRYPMLGESLRQDGKYGTGMMVYAWYVWDKSHKGEPVIRWIDNNADVLAKRDLI